MNCFFVSDLHGSIDRYTKLFAKIREEKPEIVLLGGDLLPHAMDSSNKYFEDFVNLYLYKEFNKLKVELDNQYPEVLLILGNDDYKIEEQAFLEHDTEGLWKYLHNRNITIDGYDFFGYSCVPPTPFLLKDWEVYDVSRFVDPGCISPEEGRRSVDVSEQRVRFGTIKEDLETLFPKDKELSNTVLLFHSPPHNTKLDRAALDGKMIDFVPLDPHVGSIAIQRFIKARQPLLTLHGHVHESTELTGSWQDSIDKTVMFNAAHNKKELALIRFNLRDLKNASRELI